MRRELEALAARMVAIGHDVEFILERDTQFVGNLLIDGRVFDTGSAAEYMRRVVFKNEPRHTPAPWSVSDKLLDGRNEGWRDVVAQGVDGSPFVVAEALERDAAIIAAAPEMLAALKRLSIRLNNLYRIAEFANKRELLDTMQGADEEVRDALLKAKGEGLNHGAHR